MRELGLRHPGAARLRAQAHVEHALDPGRLELGDERVGPQLLVADGPERRRHGPASIASRTSASVGSRPKPVRHHVAPACSHGAGSVPAGLVTTMSNGPLGAGAQLAHRGGQLGERLGALQVDREDPVPARGAAHRPAVGPARRDPDRDPRLLRGRGRELAAPQLHEPLEALVEQARALARIGRVAERRELAVAVAADADAEHEPAAAEAVERDRLARELGDPPPRRRGHQRADAHALGRARDRGHRDPRVGELAGVHVDEVVPEEEAVPAAGLGRLGEPREPARVSELPEGGDEDRAPGSHAATVAAQPKTGSAAAGRARPCRPGCCAGPRRTCGRRRSASSARSGSWSTSTGSWNAVRIFVGSGISGSIAGEMPHGTLSAIGNILSRATLSSCSALRQPPAGGDHRHRVGAADGRDRHDRHARRDRQLHEALAARRGSPRRARSRGATSRSRRRARAPRRGRGERRAIESGAAGSTPIRRK